MPNYSVLVVEDEVQLRTTLIRFLHEEGYTVQGTPDGESALSWLAQQPFDILLLDMSLPRMDGWELARRLRESGQDTAIVVLTAAERAREVADQIGAVGYVAKPFALLHLLRVLERALEEEVA